MRMLSSLVFLLLNCSISFGQFTLVGPDKADPGNLIVITATEFKGEDIIIECFPQNSFWTANKNLKGEPQVSFATNKQGTYSFVFGTNSNKQTFIKVWTVQVGPIQPVPPGPIPPNPNPVPTPSPATDLSKRFDPVYMVSPNKDQLTKYIAVFSALKVQVDSDKFTNYKQAWDVLVSATKVALMSDTDLRSLRDEVAKYMVEKTGPQASKYDKVVLSTTLGDIINALTIVQKAH